VPQREPPALNWNAISESSSGVGSHPEDLYLCDGDEFDHLVADLICGLRVIAQQDAVTEHIVGYGLHVVKIGRNGVQRLLPVK
jgi:hypothetical protein